MQVGKAGLLVVVLVGCATAPGRGDAKRDCVAEADELQRYVGTLGDCETDEDCRI